MEGLEDQAPVTPASRSGIIIVRACVISEAGPIDGVTTDGDWNDHCVSLGQ